MINRRGYTRMANGLGDANVRNTPLDFSKIIHAIILSNLVLGEVLTLKQIIGCCVILLGLVVMLFEKNHNFQIFVIFQLLEKLIDLISCFA